MTATNMCSNFGGKWSSPSLILTLLLGLLGLVEWMMMSPLEVALLVDVGLFRKYHVSNIPAMKLLIHTSVLLF